MSHLPENGTKVEKEMTQLKQMDELLIMCNDTVDFVVRDEYNVWDRLNAVCPPGKENTKNQEKLRCAMEGFWENLHEAKDTLIMMIREEGFKEAAAEREAKGVKRALEEVEELD